MARAAAEGAYLNVRINTASLKQRDVADTFNRKAEAALATAKKQSEEVWKICTTEK